MAYYEWLGPAADQPPYRPSHKEQQLIDHFKVVWLDLMEKSVEADRAARVIALREGAILDMMDVDHLPFRVCEHILETAELEALYAL